MYFRSIYCHSFHLYFIKLKEIFLFKITLLLKKIPRTITSNIKDHNHHNKHSNRKRLKYCEHYQHVTQRHKARANAVGKMAPVDLLNEGVPQSFNL